MMNTPTRSWIKLGTIAFMMSGLISLLLIIGRTIDKSDGTVIKDYFQLSVIMHVNFGILIWLLSITIAYFNLSNSSLRKSSYYGAVLSFIILTISAFGQGEAYSNNYIPIFDNSLFKLGIGLFLAVTMFESIHCLIGSKDIKARCTAAILVLTMLCFVGSFVGIKEQAYGQVFYEFLFWGGGHVMQFAFVSIMVIAWIKMSHSIFETDILKNKQISLIFKLQAVLLVPAVIFIYSSFPVETGEHINAFTKLMIFGNSLLAFPFAAVLFIHLITNISKFKNPLYLSLFFSLTLFTIGGTLGTKAAHAIANGEITTIIPAHYHGSVIAVTVALMGFVYTLIPQSKWAGLQIALYSVGQIMHITGMAILGGHGAARKEAGLEQLNLAPETAETIKFMMHTGGGFLAIGGIMFIVIVLRALRQNQQLSQSK